MSKRKAIWIDSDTREILAEALNEIVFAVNANKSLDSQKQFKTAEGMTPSSYIARQVTSLREELIAAEERDTAYTGRRLARSAVWKAEHGKEN